MRIVIAGSSGFLGSHLVRAFTAAGHDVLRLVRREPRSAGESRWDPAGGTLDPVVVDGADVVINLAGANVGRPWTTAYKQKIVSSRIDSTATLARAIAAAQRRPAALLNSSAIGIYGDTGDRAVDEQSLPGTGFLADLGRAWEGATAPAGDAGVRVVLLRTGLPLDRNGGLLQPLVWQFRLGVGGRLGSGRQYLPWISLSDWVGAVRFLIERDDLSGPVNLTGPAPVTNAEFTRALGHLLHRPTFVAAPGLVLRTVLGEFGASALASARVLPGVLTTAGYRFQHPDVMSALRAALH